MRIDTNWLTGWRIAVILAIYFIVVSTYAAGPAGALLALMNVIVAVFVGAVFVVCWRIVRSAITR